MDQKIIQIQRISNH